MENKFLLMIECLLGRKAVGNIANYETELSEIVKKFNQVLNIRNEEQQFVSHYYDGNTIMAPVPFVSNSQNKKVNIAYIGLNPHLDTSSKKATQREKLDAGITWEQYAHYYTSEGIFQHVLHDIGKFYKYVISVAASIHTKEYVKFTEFRGNLTNGELSKKALEELHDYIGFETIPFHSKKFQLGPNHIELLLQRVPEYACYIDGMCRVMKEQVAENGWIICNGKSSCEVFKKIIELHCPEEPLEPLVNLKEERAYSFYRWNGRKVLMFHHFIGAAGRGLKLCAHEDIQRMLEHAFTVFAEQKS